MKFYRSLPPDLSARAYLTVPFDESADARMLGCSWDRARHSWWINRAAIADTPYVWRWMDESDPLRHAAKETHGRLERQNDKKLKSRTQRARQRRYQ